MIVLDTDFFSSFFKIGRLKLILDISGEEKVVIPGTVYDELKRTSFFDEILYSLAFSEDDIDDERYIMVKKVDLSICDSFIDSEEITGPGKGELGCMVRACENWDGGFMGFSSQTMLGGITSRVYIGKYSTEDLKKMWSENCRRMMKDYDPHEPATVGEPGLLYVIMPALRIKDWDHAYLEMDFGEIGEVKE